MDTASVRARVWDAYPEGPDAVRDLILTVVADVAVQVETLTTTMSAPQSENAALHTENAALRARVGTAATTEASRSRRMNRG